jgi:EmrB/QacA subfamily drug resistance transporter
MSVATSSRRSPPSSPPPGALPRSGRGWALPVLLTGTFVIVLDFFIVNVALPSMQATLRSSHSATEWFVAAYGLTFASGLITAGRLGDRYGRRRVLEAGLALFTLASVACAAAPTSGGLIVARLMQGLAAALISPQVLSIICVSYLGADRVRALSAYGIVMGVGAVGGQVLGGLLIDADLAGLAWRSIFLINVPIGLLALALTSRHVPESRSERPSALDPIGAASSAAALAALILALTEGRQQGWPVWAWASLALALGLSAAFVWHQRRLARRGGAALVSPDLFKARSFSAGLATQLALWCGEASFFLILALYLQQGRGLSALQAGLVFTCVAAGFVAASAPAWTLRHGRRVIAAGASAVVLGDLLLLACVVSSRVSGAVALLAPGLLLVGAGQGMCITPITATVLSSLDPQDAGAASGVLSTMQQVGNALGVAITGAIFFGALHRGYASAFELALAELATLLAAVAAMTRLLPGGSRS